ncbi:MAG: LysR family transcriptional regulator [Treponema sp.]|nr:LysR family transcriptional regulator [Treponema sp.]
MTLEQLQKRAEIIREIRTFFDSRRYLQVDTPLLAPDLIPENCLEVFETSWLPAAGSRQQPEKRWLIPSPEIWMKRLIAEHGTDMYQICKCFRNTESRGNLHSPEFTMLEYYTMNADYMDSLALTENLFFHLSENLSGTNALFRQPVPQIPFMRITMEEAFSTWAGFSLSETASAGRTAMEKEAERLGIDLGPEPVTDTIDDRAAIALLYDLIFIHTVEPSLPKDRPVVLLDYPAFVPCLAKNKKTSAKDYLAKERWELYINGIELANCYSEETNPQELHRYFEEEAKSKEQNALVKHRINHDYWKYLRPAVYRQSDPADYSGVAMGLDRLIMILSGNNNIESVLPFSF